MENIVLYTIYTRRAATLISNALHKQFGKYVQMNEIIPKEEYVISYNLRNLINIYHIDKYKNVNIQNLFKSIKIDGIYYFPPEIELMHLYHRLYLPTEYSNWENLIKYEDILYNKITEKSGGATESKSCNDCVTTRKIDINNVKTIFLNFLNNENYILIGEWAHRLVDEQQDIANDNNIQIISENDIEDDYNNISQFLSTYTNYGIYYKKKK